MSTHDDEVLSKYASTKSCTARRAAAPLGCGMETLLGHS